MQSKLSKFLQSSQLFCVIKSNLQTPPVYLLLFIVLISLASCLVETTMHVETVLLATLLLENGLMHLPNLAIKFTYYRMGCTHNIFENQEREKGCRLGGRGVHQYFP